MSTILMDCLCIRIPHLVQISLTAHGSCYQPNNENRKSLIFIWHQPYCKYIHSFKYFLLTSHDCVITYLKKTFIITLCIHVPKLFVDLNPRQTGMACEFWASFECSIIHHMESAITLKIFISRVHTTARFTDDPTVQSTPTSLWVNSLWPGIF